MTSPISDNFRQPWAFDLDGVLVDTRRAVVEAYKYVGVDMPDGAWGLPYREWHTVHNADELHKKKNTYYYKTVGLFAKPMPLLKVAESWKYPVLTGASHTAVEIICLKFAMNLFVPLRGASLDDKIKWLKSHRPG